MKKIFVVMAALVLFACGGGQNHSANQIPPINNEVPLDQVEEKTYWVEHHKTLCFPNFVPEIAWCISGAAALNAQAGLQTTVVPSNIQGFQYEQGFRYLVKVNRFSPAHPLADAPSFQDTFIEILDKVPADINQTFDFTLFGSPDSPYVRFADSSTITIGFRGNISFNCLPDVCQKIDAAFTNGVGRIALKARFQSSYSDPILFVDVQ